VVQCGSYKPLSVLSHAPEKEAQVVRHGFDPNMTTLEDNTLDMLFQSSVCWWNPLHIHECSTLVFLDVSECTCSVTSSAMSSMAVIPCSFLSMSNKFNADAVSHPVSA